MRCLLLLALRCPPPLSSAFISSLQFSQRVILYYRERKTKEEKSKNQQLCVIIEVRAHTLIFLLFPSSHLFWFC